MYETRNLQQMAELPWEKPPESVTPFARKVKKLFSRQVNVCIVNLLRSNLFQLHPQWLHAAQTLRLEEAPNCNTLFSTPHNCVLVLTAVCYFL